ncbi:MAG: peptidase M64 [Ignavibacteriales bacterium]|nr:peptidase M64 [Ignavibacteriales bacterium]
MKKYIFFLLFPVILFPQINYYDYFEDKCLRLDYYHSGNYENEYYSFDQLIEEPFWGGSKKCLIDDFNYGNYYVKVFDKASDKLLYSRGYSTLFFEYQTTEEAKTLDRTFHESVVIPYPKNAIRIELYSRNKKGIFEKKFQYGVDPKTNYFITKEQRLECDNFQIHNSGLPEDNLDIVFLPEGYTKEEMNKFKEDCQFFSDVLFQYAPYKENKDKINIWGVLAYSEDSGTDIPGDNVWEKTVMNSTFYTFNSERYVMTDDYKSVRDVAANAPCDAIIILVNTEKYGGGGIFNFYATFAAHHPSADKIFIHEFGHSFGALADEYWTSDVAYLEFYPLDVEPWEPNLTTLVDFDSKWKDMLDEDTPIPTPVDRENPEKVGVYEGGGYVAKGVYRPSMESIMKSLSAPGYNAPSVRAIDDLIKFYSK